MDWIDRAERLVSTERAVVRVTLVEATGPTPRDIGAGALVTSSTCDSRIGRGDLQVSVIEFARSMLATMPQSRSDGPALWHRKIASYPTGPVLGASSGGTKTMLFELLGPAELRTLEGQSGGPVTHSNEDEHIAAKSTDGLVLLRPLASGLPAVLVKPTGDIAGLPNRAATALATLRFSAAQTVALSGDTHADFGDRWLAERLTAPSTPFYVYGTGLLARALVRVLAGLPFDVVWIDQDPDRFPASPPAHVTLLASDRQPEIARAAPAGAFHAVMTVSHDLDFAIVRAALETGAFAYLGVIGSRMKRKRLNARLAECGVPPDRLARLVCPIGLPGISSKTPAVIAVSIAAQALQALQALQPGTVSQVALLDRHGVGSKR